MINFRKIFLSFLFIICTNIFITGCSNNTDSTKLEISSNIAKLKIVTDENSILYEKELNFKDGDTVFDLLKNFCRENNIFMDFSGRGSSAYVTAIGNLHQLDKGPQSGWTYKVNNEMPSVGCGDYKLKQGDIVIFQYITSYE